MLKFHALGDWLPSAVRYRQIESTRVVIPEVEEIVERAWQRAISTPGVNLFDGPMVRLESWDAGAELQLTLSRTSYKTFLGTNLYHADLADRYGPAVLANPVGVRTALETSDGWLMFGRRNASVAYYPNRIHPFAGALEPKDASDVFTAVRRELAEELSLGDADIEDIRCTGIAEDLSIRQSELIFRAKVNHTRAQIELHVDRTEHHESWAVQADRRSIDAALTDVSIHTPVAVAAILMWGRIAFGPAWFEAHRNHPF